MDEREQVLAVWRYMATPPELMALISLCDYAVRQVGTEQMAITRAAVMVTQAVLAGLDLDAMLPFDVVEALMWEARQRRGGSEVTA